MNRSFMEMGPRYVGVILRRDALLFRLFMGDAISILSKYSFLRLIGVAIITPSAALLRTLCVPLFGVPLFVPVSVIDECGLANDKVCAMGPVELYC